VFWGYVVHITASSTKRGSSTDNLLMDEDSYWISNNVPNSWIQWTVARGITVILSSVKFMEHIGHSGVKDSVIEGPNDSPVWTSIIDSKT
jgi:hypothetical protein